MGAAPDKPILVASIVGPHGVRGLVRLQSFTDPAEGLAAYDTLVDDKGLPVKVTLQSRDKTQYLARIAGVEDRTQAERLKGLKLFVPRATLAPAEEGSFYHADLVGLAAVDPAGAVLGKVEAVHNFGAGDIVEIRGQGRPDFMVPFTKAFVPEVDMATGRLVIAPFEVSE
jgi:16S rRNA processing protein RimM